jgi:adenylyltransferase/sulfurtransferase
VLPGLLGVIQATETINLLLGVGEPLIGRLLLVDALGMEFREVRVRKDPACRICGDTPELTALREEEWACELPETASGAIPTITVERLAERLRAGDELVVLDVREPHEVEICALPGSLRIPLGQLSENLHRLNSADEIVVHCKLGGRSAKAVGLLEQAGFRKVYNLEGGIDRWAERVEVGMPRY